MTALKQRSWKVQRMNFMTIFNRRGIFVHTMMEDRHDSLKPLGNLIFLVLHNRLVYFKLIKVSLTSISENYTALQVLPFSKIQKDLESIFSPIHL